MHSMNNSFLPFFSFTSSFHLFFFHSTFFPLTHWGFFFLIFYDHFQMCWCSYHPLFCVVIFFFFYFIEYSFGSKKLCFVVDLRMCHNFSLLDFMAQHIALLMQVQTIEQFSTFQAYTWIAFLLHFVSLSFSFTIISYHIVDRCRCTLHH